MSSPPNPLDTFRSYSYHHILIACDGTTTADEISKLPLSSLHHPSEKFCPQVAPRAGNYVVLVNGMTDAQFFIRSAKWSSVMVPKVRGSGQSHASTTMAVDGELQIVEPRGVNFYNILNQVTKSLRIDPSAMIYVLKTVFVGISDVGQEEMISTIRPFPFILTDITSSFDHTGAEYSISFVGMVNGAGKMPHCNSIVQGFSGQIPAGSDIPGALQYIANRLNTLYGNQKETAIKAATLCNDDSDFNVNTLEDEFMDVEYVINVLGDAYKGYKAGDAYTAARSNDSSGGAYVSDFGESTSIERIIDEVMRSSKQVIEESKGPVTSNANTSKRYMYKITSNVKVDRANAKYTVTYNVSRFVGTVVPAADVDTFELPEGPNGEELGITFDYIFTGNNVDVLEFNLDMQYGLTFLQLLGTTTSCPTSRVDSKMFSNPDTVVAGVGNKDGAGDQKSPDAYCSNATQSTDSKDNVVKKPLFLGTMATNPTLRDTRVPGATTSFNSLLHRIAALENIGAVMKIRGNPQLLEDSTLQNVDIEKGTPPPTVPYSERSVIPSMHTIPGYVKVNVMMPRAWQMNETEGDHYVAEAAGDYASAFWYNGWYQLLQITHEFDEGDFTQELEIYSLPTDAGQSTIGKCIDEFIHPPKADETKRNKPQPANTKPATTTPTTAATTTTAATAKTSEVEVTSQTINQRASKLDGATQ